MGWTETEIMFEDELIMLRVKGFVNVDLYRNDQLRKFEIVKSIENICYGCTVIVAMSLYTKLSIVKARIPSPCGLFVTLKK